MGVERYLVASSIECVVASRLARKLCTECRRPVTIDASTLRDAGYRDTQIENFEGFEAVGCARCSGTGYRGRTGLFEVLSIDDEIREMLLERFPSKAIEAKAREHGMVTLADSAMERVRQGVVSLAEAARVTSTD
jgi:type IV pilus assembly protein PilB